MATVASEGDAQNGAGANPESASATNALVCVYFDDCWDKSHAVEVLRWLVKDHGEVPAGCKADFYTLAGIDSKMVSG